MSEAGQDDVVKDAKASVLKAQTIHVGMSATAEREEDETAEANIRSKSHDANPTAIRSRSHDTRSAKDESESDKDHLAPARRKSTRRKTMEPPRSRKSPIESKKSVEDHEEAESRKSSVRSKTADLSRTIHVAMAEGEEDETAETNIRSKSHDANPTAIRSRSHDTRAPAEGKDAEEHVPRTFRKNVQRRKTMTEASSLRSRLSPMEGRASASPLSDDQDSGSSSRSSFRQSFKAAVNLASLTGKKSRKPRKEKEAKEESTDTAEQPIRDLALIRKAFSSARRAIMLRTSMQTPTSHRDALRLGVQALGRAAGMVVRTRHYKGLNIVRIFVAAKRRHDFEKERQQYNPKVEMDEIMQDHVTSIFWHFVQLKIDNYDKIVPELLKAFAEPGTGITESLPDLRRILSDQLRCLEAEIDYAVESGDYEATNNFDSKKKELRKIVESVMEQASHIRSLVIYARTVSRMGRMKNAAHDDPESLFARIQSLDVSQQLMRKLTNEKVSAEERRRRRRAAARRAAGRSESGEEAEAEEVEEVEDESSASSASSASVSDSNSVEAIEEETQEQLEAEQSQESNGSDPERQIIADTETVAELDPDSQEIDEGEVMADDLASADLLNLPPLPEESESANNPSNLEDEGLFSPRPVASLVQSEGSRTFSGKLTLGPNWSRLQSYISEAENEPLDLEAMAAESASVVFRRFEYSDDWEEQIEEYIESRQPDEMIVQDNRGVVLAFPGHISPSDFPLIVRCEDPTKNISPRSGRGESKNTSTRHPSKPGETSRRRGSAAFSWAAWEEEEPVIPERRTQTPKMESPESVEPQKWDHLETLMDHADVPLASLAEGSPEPRGSSPFAASTPTSRVNEERTEDRTLSNTLGSLDWLEDSVLPRKVKMNLRKLRFDPGAEVKGSPPPLVEMRSTMFPATPKIAKADGTESALGALRRVRKKQYKFPDADEVLSMREWHDSEDRIKSSWQENSSSAAVPFLDLVPVVGGEARRGRSRAANMPFGHVAKPRFHYSEFEETNQLQVDPAELPRRKTPPVRPGTRMIGKMRSPLVHIKEDFMSITAITSFHRLCKVQR